MRCRWRWHPPAIICLIGGGSSEIFQRWGETLVPLPLNFRHSSSSNIEHVVLFLHNGSRGQFHNCHLPKKQDRLKIEAEDFDFFNKNSIRWEGSLLFTRVQDSRYLPQLVQQQGPTILHTADSIQLDSSASRWKLQNPPRKHVVELLQLLSIRKRS